MQVIKIHLVYGRWIDGEVMKPAQFYNLDAARNLAANLNGRGHNVEVMTEEVVVPYCQVAEALAA